MTAVNRDGTATSLTCGASGLGAAAAKRAADGMAVTLHDRSGKRGSQIDHNPMLNGGVIRRDGAICVVPR